MNELFSIQNKEDDPKWSIVMSFYNRDQLLPESIESCLQQTYTDFELVLVDDGSSDNSIKVARRYAQRDPRIRIVEHKYNRGICAGYTSAYDAARGRYILRLCSDDYLEPDAVESFNAVFSAHPEVALVNSNLNWVTYDREYQGSLNAQEPQDLNPNFNRLGISFAITKDVWNAVRPFDLRCAGAEDFDLMVRILERFPGRKVSDKKLYNVRTEGLRVSSKSDLVYRGLTHMHLKRRWRAFARSPFNIGVIAALLKCSLRKTIGEVIGAAQRHR